VPAVSSWFKSFPHFLGAPRRPWRVSILNAGQDGRAIFWRFENSLPENGSGGAGDYNQPCSGGSLLVIK
jgi:hypothetical protein